MDEITQILRTEYKGLGYTPSGALASLWSDFDLGLLAQFAAETDISATDLVGAVSALSHELTTEVK